MPKPKVLVTTSSFPRWEGDILGGGNFIYELSKRLAADFDISVLGPHAPGARKYEELNGVKVYRYGYWPFGAGFASSGGILPNLKKNRFNLIQVPFFLAAQFAMTIRLARRNKIDVIVANWIVPQGVVAALGRVVDRRLRVVLVALGGDVALIRKNRYFAMIGRAVLKKADRVIAVSNSLKDGILDIAPPGMRTVDVIAMGVDESRYSGCRHRRAQEKDGSVKSLLFVGRLEEKKGVAYLLRAMPRVLEKLPDAVLTIVGSGTLREELEDLSSDLGIRENVIFRDAVEYSLLPKLFEDAKIFVVPSVNLKDDIEGLPTIILDAVAAKVPVVATDAGGIRDVIEDDVSGVLVRQGNVEELAAKIVELMNNSQKRKELADCAFGRLIAEFSHSVIRKKYSGILNSLFGEGE